MDDNHQLGKVAPGDLLCFKKRQGGGSLWVEDDALRNRIFDFKTGDVALVIGHSIHLKCWMMVLSRGRYGMIPFLTKWEKIA